MPQFDVVVHIVTAEDSKTTLRQLIDHVSDVLGDHLKFEQFTIKRILVDSPDDSRSVSVSAE